MKKRAKKPAAGGEALRFEDLLGDPSAAFVRVNPTQIDAEIERRLRRVVLALGLELVLPVNGAVAARS